MNKQLENLAAFWAKEMESNPIIFLQEMIGLLHVSFYYETDEDLENLNHRIKKVTSVIRWLKVFQNIK